MDLLLAGAWLALAYAYLSGRERPPTGMSPAFFLIGLFLAATLVEAMLAENLARSMFAMRASVWLMSVLLLVPLWASTPHRRQVLFRAALVVGAIVSAYAMLRWAIGPASKEKERVLDAATGFSTNELGEVKLLGSLPSAQALTFWSSAMFAFSLAAALSPIGTRWRLLAVVVAGMCGAAVFGADVRFGMVAAAAGGVAVLVLFGCARGFTGRRVMPLAAAVVIGTVGVGVFVTTKLTAEGNSGDRFHNLVTNPIDDNSVQQRFVKWDTLLAEVDDKPFGKGVGASGAAEKKYARFTSAASLDPDSSYVKIAYDQGFVMVVLFAAAILSLLIALAMATMSLSSPIPTASALGACGALVAFIVAMSAGSHYEGLVALGPWMLVAIGSTALVKSADPG
ncbi:MAG TPA: O-antigen ligase family protein [Acetobacteraceae bacterium]|nr:O-antigen ligase family protein [Acetobacteraceae bacterium]